MSSRYRKPETVKIPISRGDWLLVKKHLTSGEERDMYARMSSDGVTVNATRVQPTKIAAYLLDWSLTGVDDKPVVIADQDYDAKIAALDDLPPEDFSEILKAIDAHDKAMEALREQEKNALDGAISSSQISPSVEPSQAGPSNTSTDSTLMSVM